MNFAAALERHRDVLKNQDALSAGIDGFNVDGCHITGDLLWETSSYLSNIVFKIRNVLKTPDPIGPRTENI